MATTYYFLPTRNLFGEDSVKETGSLMQSLGGKKALIVTDAFLAKNGMAENIQTILSDAGVESTVFGGVVPNPKDVLPIFLKGRGQRRNLCPAGQRCSDRICQASA